MVLFKDISTAKSYKKRILVNFLPTGSTQVIVLGLKNGREVAIEDWFESKDDLHKEDIRKG